MCAVKRKEIGTRVKMTNVAWSGEELTTLEKGFQIWLKDNPNGSQSQFVRTAVTSFIDGVLEANQEEEVEG